MKVRCGWRRMALVIGVMALAGCVAGPAELIVDRRSGETDARFAVASVRSPGKHKGDYLPAHAFKIEIDGVLAGSFKEISGLESEVEVIEYRGGDGPTAQYRPGKDTVTTLVLKGGFVADPRFYEWYLKAIEGRIERKSGSIIGLNRDGSERMRIQFFEAWPCRWSSPGGRLNPSGMVEEIEFVVEKIERS